MELVEWLESLDKGHDHKVDHCAYWGIVVERDDWVHLHSVEENLDHDETRCLKDDSCALADKADHLKVDFSVGCEEAAEGDHADNGKEARVGLLELEGKGDDKDGDGVEGLEHLDEGHAEGQVGVVGENEGAREESTDGQDGLEPAVALEVSIVSALPYGHLDVLGAIDEGGGALQHACSDGLEVSAGLHFTSLQRITSARW